MKYRAGDHVSTIYGSNVVVEKLDGEYYTVYSCLTEKSYTVHESEIDDLFVADLFA